MTRYCKCFDHACRYNLCARTLRVSDLELLDEATGERIFSVYCEHGTGFAKGNVREKDIVFTDSQGRESGDNQTAAEHPPSLAPLFDGSTNFTGCNDEDKLCMGLRYLTDFVKECIAAKERRMFGCPLFIRTIQELADTAGSSIRPAETQLAEGAWAAFSNALRVALTLFSKGGLFDATPFTSWLKNNPNVTCKVGGYDFYRGISKDVLFALKEQCREIAVKCHPDYEDEIEMLFCGVADGMDGLPHFLPFAEEKTSPTVRDPEPEYAATQQRVEDFSSTEMAVLLDFFEKGGYVLDGMKLTDNVFNQLTEDAVGVRVKELYAAEGLSKGKSLRRYVAEHRDMAFKLFMGLFEYYEERILDEDEQTWDKNPDDPTLGGNRTRKAYERCRQILLSALGAHIPKRRTLVAKPSSSRITNDDIMAEIRGLRGQLSDVSSNVDVGVSRINRLHDRFDNRDERGTYGKNLGDDEKRRAFELWQDGQTKVTPSKNVISYEDVYNAPLYRRKINALGISSADDFRKAVEAYMKTQKNRAKATDGKKGRQGES